MIFEDRKQAGLLLSQKLKKYKNKKESIVIGLPRGGVVLAYEVAKSLNLPLDIIVTRKISDPINPELAVGALTQEGKTILDKKIVDLLGIKKENIDIQILIEKEELKRRLKNYRGNKPKLNLKNKEVIIVDDGIATGLTIKAAIESANNQGAKKIILAIPVGPKETIKKMEKLVDELICLDNPISFRGISQFYKNFKQVEDDEVVNLLK